MARLGIQHEDRQRPARLVGLAPGATRTVGRVPQAAPAAHAIRKAWRVAARVPPGRRWVHPKAEVVLAEMLRNDAPEPELHEIGRALVAAGAMGGFANMFALAHGPWLST